MTAPKVGDPVTIPYWDGPETRSLRETDFAVMLDGRNGEVADVAYNWETAESMILDGGYVALVIDGGASDDVAADQRRMDDVRAAYVDCWGV